MFVHQSNSLGVLIDALAELLRDPERPLFERPQIMIQSAGMERYLSRELARRSGVSLGIDFPYPRAFFERLEDMALGPIPDGASFAREELTFHLFRLLGESGYPEVRAYLEGDLDRGARLELSAELSRLFDQYSVYRPRLLSGWLSASDGDFQGEMWSQLVAELGPYDTGSRIEALCALPDASLRAALPRRLFVFGGAGLPPLHLRALSRLAQVTEVHLFSFTVCQAYFVDAHSAGSELAEVGAGLHPLIVSLGRVGGDFQYYLEQLHYREGTHHFVEDRGDSLLALLKRDILAGVRATRELLPLEKKFDGSLTMVSCHSALREVEVLRENLLELFERDPTLRAEDVVVLTPQIEAYTPLVRAVFGGTAESEAVIPFRIADESEGTANASVAALLRALSLFSRRFKVSEVLSVLQMDPVLARFEMTAQDLERVTEWLAGSGIRWGIDREHAREFGFDESIQTTWELGLSRLLLGFVMEDRGQVFRDLVPFDDVAESDADLLARLCDFMRALSEAGRILMRPCSVSAFVAAVRKLAADIVVRPEDDSLQARSILDALSKLEDCATSARVTEPISPQALTRFLEAELVNVRQSTDFLSGGLTFCELLPLRTIPFRVVCVLGLSEESFPRSDRESSLDRMAGKRMRGDRLLRFDDRYLFLELLMSAEEKLILSYVGRSVQDNSELSPSVVLSELEQAIDTMLDGGKASPRRLVLEHPLQPFSHRYFDRVDPRYHSRSLEAYHGARALAVPRPAGSEDGAPDLRLRRQDSGEPILLRDLEAFFRNPSRYFLRSIGVVVDDEISVLADREPVSLSGLERHEVGQRILDGLLEGRPFDTHVAELRGLFPGGVSGERYALEIRRECLAIDREVRELVGSSAPVSVDVRLSLGEVELQGIVPQVFEDVHVLSSYGKARAGRLLTSWIRHLCLNAMGKRSRTAFVGRNKKSGQPEIHEFSPVEPGRATVELGRLVEIFLEGSSVPLRFDLEAAHAVAEARRRARAPKDPAARRIAFTKAARAALTPGLRPGHAREIDPSLALLFGKDDPLLLGAHSADEDVPFLNLSELVFGPLLDARQTRIGEEAD